MALPEAMAASTSSNVAPEIVGRHLFLAHGVLRIDGVLHRHDAPRGEGLAVAVVAEQHRLLHRLRDVRLAAEHFGDGVPEDRARRVVGGLLAGLAQNVARLVQAQGGDGDPLAGQGGLCAGGIASVPLRLLR